MILMRVLKLALHEGRLTFWARCFLYVIGFGIIYSSFAYSPNMIILTLGLCVGFVIVSIVAYSNKAESLNLPTPFTSLSDPLGWRKAKKSYEEKPEATKEDEPASSVPPELSILEHKASL